MGEIAAAAERTGAKVDQQVRKVAPWVEALAHLGYAAKGLLYVGMGAIAAQVAAGQGGRVTDSRGVLATVARLPGGMIALFIAAFGFAGCAVWRLVGAICDGDNCGRDAKGLAKRVAFALGGIVYAALCVATVRLLAGARSTSSGREPRQWSARAMSLPGGRWIVVAVGVGIVLYGAWQLVRAVRGKLGTRLRLGAMEAGTRHVVIAISRFGIAARAVVFMLLGWFLMRAGLTFDPSEARGLGGALRALQHAAYGPVVLGVTALGFAAYGGYLFAQARYREIRAA